jgi:hypothetical protein
VGKRTLVLVASLIAGCSLFTDLGGLSEGDPPILDGGGEGSVDAEPPPDAIAPPADGASESAYAREVLADAPLVYLRLGEATGDVAVDAQGRHSGRYAGTFTLGEPGLVYGDPDRAVRLDGVDGRVPIALIPDFMLGDAPFTIEAWIAPDVIPDSPRWIIGREEGLGAVRSGVSFVVESSAIALEHWAVGSARRVDLPLPRVKAPNHVVATYDGETIQAWLDGVPSGAQATAGPVPEITHPVVVGSQAGQANGFFPGVIDEVALYDRALAPARILAHYDAGRAP